MLSTQSRPVIEATLPIIGARISSITPNFYDRLFAAHPQLLDGIFSRSNQKTEPSSKHWPAPSRCSPPT